MRKILRRALCALGFHSWEVTEDCIRCVLLKCRHCEARGVEHFD